MKTKATDLLTRIVHGEVATIDRATLLEARAALDELDPVQHPAPERLAYLRGLLSPIAPESNEDRAARAAMIRAAVEHEQKNSATTADAAKF